jgi:hypothetical protein
LESTAPQVSVKTRRRGRAWKLLSALALLVALGAALRLLRVPERLAARSAGRALGAEVTVGRIEYSWPRALVLHDVVAALPSAPAPFLTLPRTTLELGLLPPRIAAVVVDEARLVVRERPDGTFELPAPPPGDGKPGAVPRLRVDLAHVELEGSGPLHERIADVAGDGVARAVEVRTFSLTPRNDGGFDANADVAAAGLGQARLIARGGAAGFERLTVRVDAQHALDFDALRGAVAPAIRAALDREAVKGRATGELRLAFGAAPGVEADVDLLDVEVKSAAFPATLAGLRGRVELRGDTIRLQGLTGHHGPGAVRVTGEVRDLSGRTAAHIVVRVDSAVADDELHAALQCVHVGKVIDEALRPEGRYSVTATVDVVAGEEPRLALDLELEDNALLFEGFLCEDGLRHGLPMRVESIRGRVTAGMDESSYDRVTGFTRGGARVESSGKIVLERVTGTVSAFDAPVDEELIAAAVKEVGPVVREVVDLLKLRGTFDAVARFDLQDDLDLKIEAHPKALTIEPEPFPYPLACDGGKLVFEKERIVFDDVRGGAGDMNLRMRGFLGIHGDAPPLELTIEAHDVALDDVLLAAVRKLPDPRLAQAFEQLKPTGHVDLHVIWKRAAAGAPTELTIEVAPNDVRLEGFGGKIVVTGLRGTVAIHRTGDGPWELTASGTGLSARAFGGGVSLSGRMTEGGAAGAAESPASLRLVGRRLRLDPESIAAVRCLAPDVATLFEAYHLRGRASVECEITRRDGAIDSHLDVVPDMAPVGVASPDPSDAVGEGLAADSPWLALPLQWTSGVMHADLRGGTFTFERLGGRIGGAVLRASGGRIHVGENGIDVEVALLADGLTFAETTELVLGPVLGPEKRKALAPWSPLGRTRVDAYRVNIHVPPGADLVDRVDVAGSVDLDGWTLYTGGALRDLSGRVAISSLHYEQTGHGVDDVRADGRLEGIAVDLGGLRFSNVTSDVLLADGRLTIPWLAAEFAGGRLMRDRNHLGIELKDELPIDGQLEILSADVSRLLGEETPRMRGLAGRVDAALRFHCKGRSLLRGHGLPSLEAAGRVEVRDAKLWTIPLFDKLYSAAVLPLTGSSRDEYDLADGGGSGKPEPPKWQRGRFDFALQGVYVRLSDVEFEGEPLVLRGDGTLGPEQLEMHFHPEVKTGTGWLRGLPIVGPVIGWLLSSIEHELGAFRFGGPYGNPQVTWDPVTFSSRSDEAPRSERPRTVAEPARPKPARF